MKRPTLAVLAIAAYLTVSRSSAAFGQTVTTIDDFESYANNTTIANSATSMPWERFGNADTGNLVTTNTTTGTTTTAPALLDGKESAALSGLNFASATANATVAYDYYNNSSGVTTVTGTPQNFSAVTALSVLTKSLNVSGTTTRIGIFLTDGTTNLVSTTAAFQSESTTATTLSFSLTPANFTATAGSESLATVLSKISAIGFRLTNTAGTSAVPVTDTIDIDDFTATSTAAPEPTSALLLGLAAAPLALGRRRRAATTA